MDVKKFTNQEEAIAYAKSFERGKVFKIVEKCHNEHVRFIAADSYMGARQFAFAELAEISGVYPEQPLGGSKREKKPAPVAPNFDGLWAELGEID